MTAQIFTKQMKKQRDIGVVQGIFERSDVCDDEIYTTNSQKNNQYECKRHRGSNLVLTRG